MKDNFFVNASIKDGELYFPIKAQETRYKSFLKQFPDDTRIELFVSANNKKGTAAQLARVHAMCREIANEIGYTFEEVKLQVKRKAGLCFTKNNTNSFNCILVTNNWSKIDWWFSVIIYLL